MSPSRRTKQDEQESGLLSGAADVWSGLWGGVLEQDTFCVIKGNSATKHITAQEHRNASARGKTGFVQGREAYLQQEIVYNAAEYAKTKLGANFHHRPVQH